MMFSRRDRIPCHRRTLPLALPSSPPQLRQQVQQHHRRQLQQGQRHHRHHQMAQWPTCCFPRRSTFRGPFLPVRRRPIKIKTEVKIFPQKILLNSTLRAISWPFQNRHRAQTKDGDCQILLIMLKRHLKVALLEHSFIRLKSFTFLAFSASYSIPTESRMFLMPASEMGLPPRADKRAAAT